MKFEKLGKLDKLSSFLSIFYVNEIMEIVIYYELKVCFDIGSKEFSL